MRRRTNDAPVRGTLEWAQQRGEGRKRRAAASVEARQEHLASAGYEGPTDTGRGTTSRFRNVSWFKTSRKWLALISDDGFRV